MHLQVNPLWAGAQRRLAAGEGFSSKLSQFLHQAWEPEAPSMLRSPISGTSIPAAQPEPSDPRDGRDGKTGDGTGPAKAMCLGFSMKIFLSLSLSLHHIHYSFLAPAGVQTRAQKVRNSAPSLLQRSPEASEPSHPPPELAQLQRVTFGIRTAPQSLGWESNGAGLLDINGLGRHAN